MDLDSGMSAVQKPLPCWFPDLLTGWVLFGIPNYIWLWDQTQTYSVMKTKQGEPPSGMLCQESLYEASKEGSHL